MSTLTDAIAQTAQNDPVSEEARKLQNLDDDTKFVGEMRKRWDEADRAQNSRREVVEGMYRVSGGDSVPVPPNSAVRCG